MGQNYIVKSNVDGKNFYKYINNKRENRYNKKIENKVVILKSYDGSDKKVLKDFLKDKDGWVLVDRDGLSKSYIRDNDNFIKLFCKEINNELKKGNNVILLDSLSKKEENEVKKSIKDVANLEYRKKGKGQLKKDTKKKINKSSDNKDKTQYEFAKEIGKSLVVSYEVPNIQAMIERAKDIKELIDSLPEGQRKKLKDWVNKRKEYKNGNERK